MLNKIQRQVLLTRFSTSLSSSRNLSSSFTHCGNSFSPWLWACSNCSFSSLSTEISWTSRSCQVFEACRSSSRSSEVRIRRSVPTDLIEGWKKIYGQEWELPRAHWRPNNFMRLFLFLQYLLVKKKKSVLRSEAVFVLPSFLAHHSTSTECYYNNKHSRKIFATQLYDGRYQEQSF